MSLAVTISCIAPDAVEEGGLIIYVVCPWASDKKNVTRLL